MIRQITLSVMVPQCLDKPHVRRVKYVIAPVRAVQEMHPCLLVDEIARKILDYAPKRDQFSLAITCKAFAEPALDTLWHEQRSLVPLIRCMPQDLWIIKGSIRRVTRILV